jgi:hypothetical protein
MSPELEVVGGCKLRMCGPLVIFAFKSLALGKLKALWGLCGCIML